MAKMRRIIDRTIESGIAKVIEGAGTALTAKDYYVDDALLVQYYVNDAETNYYSSND